MSCKIFFTLFLMSRKIFEPLCRCHVRYFFEPLCRCHIRYFYLNPFTNINIRYSILISILRTNATSWFCYCNQIQHHAHHNTLFATRYYIVIITSYSCNQILHSDLETTRILPLQLHPACSTNQHTCTVRFNHNHNGHVKKCFCWRLQTQYVDNL